MDDEKDKDQGEIEDESLPKWGEMLKRVMSVGLGAAFMTEESVRGALGGLNVPKEVLTAMLQGANRSKEEMLNRVGNEVIKLVSKIDFVKEASRFVEEHKFKVQAEIEIVKKEHNEPGLALNTKVKIQD